MATQYLSDQTVFKAFEVSRAVEYINHHWRQLERFNPHDDGTLIGLPRPYFVPSATGSEGFGFEEMYYWDTVFIGRAFVGTERHDLARGLGINLLSLIKRFGLVPNGSRSYFTGRSQPPLLTTFLWMLYNHDKDPYWLKEGMTLAKEEYRKIWMGTAQPNWRLVHQGLSRYYDINLLHELAEAESGWDMNPRFERRCLDFLPVDLNTLLYKYERDFEAAARVNRDFEEADEWARRAARRARTINQLMWNAEAGFYFDYDYKNGRPSPVWSLAAFFPMWAGMASRAQAKKLVENLDKFEFTGGLATTAAKPNLRHSVPEQWAYPNGWAPLQLIVIEGLERYGYHNEARRIARKWLKVCLAEYGWKGEFSEKYNVVDPAQPPREGVYPSQTGFGWTNSVFLELCGKYLDAHEYRPAAVPTLAHEKPKRRGLGSLRFRLS